MLLGESKDVWMVSPINANWASKRACQCTSWFKVSGVIYSNSPPLSFSCSWLVAISVSECYLSLWTKAKRFTQLLMNRIPFLCWMNATFEEVLRAIKHLISHTLIGCRLNINQFSNLSSTLVSKYWVLKCHRSYLQGVTWLTLCLIRNFPSL